MVTQSFEVRGPSVATLFKLIIEDDEGKTTVYPLADGEISIGRREGNTIRLMERNVSRRHARLLRNNGAIYVEDLDSYNGVKINGERIHGRYEVKEGDLVEIGDYHLALQATQVRDEDARADGPTRETWPQPGALPELALPDDLVTQMKEAKSPRDTIVDQPAPPLMPAAMATTLNERVGYEAVPGTHNPLVKPPPRGEGSVSKDLPPFPTPGGLNSKPFLTPQGTAARPDGRMDSLPTKTLVPGPARIANQPRLICVSTSYAGKEFPLTRPELIIGRVEDNDVVIEHRSVSRNHAKILFDGRAHKIIDLQSANGILVNGEEYAMTDLRKGDLIELGHVRFRFIPADEPFDATEEEAREMREAGVEPQGAAPPPEAVPTQEDARKRPALKSVEMSAEVAFDPSTAATVTDTPLSALNMSDVFAPKVEHRTEGKPTVPVPVRAMPASLPTPVSPTVPMAPVVKRATEDERPTEHNRAVRAVVPARLGTSPVPDVSSEDTRRSESEAPVDAPRSKLLLILAGLALVVLGAVVVLLLGGGNEHDQQIKALAEQQRWAEVADYYKKHQNDFGDPDAAERLQGKAAVRLLEQAPRTPEPPLPPEPEPEPEPEAPDPELKAPPAAVPNPTAPPATEVVAPPDELPEGDAEDSRRPPPTKAVSATKKKLDKARGLFTDGKKALMGGDVSRAETLLLECVKLESSIRPDCHRALGVLYSQKDDPVRSVQHYKTYLRLRPTASDADKVKTMLKDAGYDP